MEGYEDCGYFDYWMLDRGTDNEKTRIVRGDKEGKYLIFYRDDGKFCKYDLSTGEVIGFSGKKVKSLSSQLKDLTTEHMIEIFDNENYRNFLKFIYRRYDRHRAWWFIDGLERNLHYEQFFSAGIVDMDYNYKLKITFDDVPKGLLKICREFKIPLTKALYDRYSDNVDIFNLYFEIDLKNILCSELNEAVIYNVRSKKNAIKVEVNDLTLRNGNIEIEHRPAPRTSKSFFFALIDKYGYQPKLLMNYYDSICIDRMYKKPDFFRELYDYANMMSDLHDDYDRYPKKFKEAFSRACKEFNNLDISYDEYEYRKRNVLDYECEIDGFRFIYPRSTKEIKEEGLSQDNCVASYIEDVLSESCHIMFMRPITDLKHSYITLEIRNNRIVQAKRKYNEEPSDEEYEIIKKWNKKYKNFGKI